MWGFKWPNFFFLKPCMQGLTDPCYKAHPRSARRLSFLWKRILFSGFPWRTKCTHFFLPQKCTDTYHDTGDILHPSLKAPPPAVQEYFEGARVNFLQLLLSMGLRLLNFAYGRDDFLKIFWPEHFLGRKNAWLLLNFGPLAVKTLINKRSNRATDRIVKSSLRDTIQK